MKKNIEFVDKIPYRLRSFTLLFAPANAREFNMHE